VANGVDDPEETDPATIGDLALFGAARSGSTSAADELRSRYRQALRTVAAGYRNRDTDREGLLDQVVGMLDAAPMPTTDGGVPLTLFALVRTARLDEAAAQGRPTGLVDLVGAHGAATLVAGTDVARRKALLGAYASLDDRDRVLLWFSAVEGTMPKALSGRLAIGGADMASTKTFRARSHLRHAYAERRSAGTDWPAECKGRSADLARLADGEQSSAAPSTDSHVASCPRCTALLAELHGLTSGLLDEAALVLGAIDAQRVRGMRAGVAAPTTAVAAATTVAPIAAPVGDFDELPPFEDEAPGRGRAFAVAGVGLLVAAAIAAFVIWGASGSDDSPVHVASPGTSRVLQVSVTTPAPTASVKSATTSTSTTRRRATTTTTTHSSSTRRHGTGGSGGGWTPPPPPPPSGSTAPTTPATVPTTTLKPTTTTTSTSTSSTTIATSTPDDTGTP
jgi:hypothetical protein